MDTLNQLFKIDSSTFSATKFLPRSPAVCDWSYSAGILNIHEFFLGGPLVILVYFSHLVLSIPILPP